MVICIYVSSLTVKMYATRSKWLGNRGLRSERANTISHYLFLNNLNLPNNLMPTTYTSVIWHCIPEHGEMTRNSAFHHSEYFKYFWHTQYYDSAPPMGLFDLLEVTSGTNKRSRILSVGAGERGRCFY